MSHDNRKYFSNVSNDLRNAEEDGTNNMLTKIFDAVADSKKYLDALKFGRIIYFTPIQKTDPEEFFICLLSFMLSCIVSQMLNILSAMKMWRVLSIPYIILELIRLAILSFSLVLILLAIKKAMNLGYLIVASILGGFGLLLLFYFWYCTVAFFNVASVVKSDTYKKQLSMMVQENIDNRKDHTNYPKSLSTVTLSADKKKDFDNKDAIDPNMTNMFIKEFSGFTGNFRKISENLIKI